MNDFNFDDGPATQERHYPNRGYRWRCPVCGSRLSPVFLNKVSPVGWCVFVLGLGFAIIGCLFGLLFRHNVRVCPECRNRV